MSLDDTQQAATEPADPTFIVDGGEHDTDVSPADAPGSIALSGLKDLSRLPEVSRDHYQMLNEFARGGIGRISEARDRRLDRKVAIKELRRNTRYAASRFTREIRITARLQHPNIVPLHEAGRWPSGEPFFAMKLVGGGSLEDAIDSCVARKDHYRLLGAVTDVCDAIAYAHDQGVVHRDIKPANVLVGPFGETVVIDWGLAKDLNDPDTDTLPSPEADTLHDAVKTTDGVVLGTPPYMPPEQAAGRPVDERADVYALGAILYHVLSGRYPYHEHKPRKVLSKVVAGPPTPLEALEPDVPPDLLAIVRKAMARDPKDRYPSAAEMSKELARFNTGGLVAVYSYSTTELLKRFVKRQQHAFVTGALASVLLLAFGVWSFVNIAEKRDRAEAGEQSAKLSATEAQRQRSEAESQRDKALLAGAESSLQHDPTLALSQLSELGNWALPGACTLAADAVERGVASSLLRGSRDRIDTVLFSPDGHRIAWAGTDGAIHLWSKGKQRLLGNHDDRVPALSFVSDAKLASVSYDRQVKLWPLAGGDARSVGEHRREARAIATSKDGKQLASIGADGVRVWSLTAVASKPQFFEAKADRPLFAAFTPDGHWLLSGSHDSKLMLWSLQGEEHRELAGHGSEVKAGLIAPDGRRAVSASEDGTIRLWKLPSGVADGTLVTTGSIEAIALSPDGKTLASGDSSGDVRLWDLDAGKSRTITTHEQAVLALAFSADGRMLASAGWDGSVHVHDSVRRDDRVLLGHRQRVATLAFAPDGKTLASGSWDHDVRLWNTAPDPKRRTIEAHEVGVKTAVFSADGKSIASGGHDNVVRVWNASDGSLRRELLGHRDHIFRVVFSPDGRWIASSSDDKTVRLWSVVGDDDFELSGHEADVEELAFSHDGRSLASAGEDGLVGLWNVSTRERRMLKAHRGAITDVHFSPDDKTLASSSRDGTIRLWDVATASVRVLESNGTEVHGIAFAPSGKQLYSVGPKQPIRVWDVAAGTARELDGQVVGAKHIAVSADGKHLAVAGTSAVTWLCPLPLGKCARLHGHNTSVHALAFSGDGKGLVTASGDGTVRLWDVASKESRPLRGHSAAVFDVAVAPDGFQLLSASADKTIRLWPFELPPAPASLSKWLTQHAIELRSP